MLFLLLAVERDLLFTTTINIVINTNNDIITTSNIHPTPNAPINKLEVETTMKKYIKL